MKIDKSVVIDEQKQFKDILPTEAFIYHDERSMYGKNGKRVLMKIVPILEYNAIDLEDGSCYSIPEDMDVVAKQVMLVDVNLREHAAKLDADILRVKEELKQHSGRYPWNGPNTVDDGIKKDDGMRKKPSPNLEEGIAMKSTYGKLGSEIRESVIKGMKGENHENNN